MAAYSVVPHSVAYLIERGFDPLFAASAFGFAGMLSAFGIIGVGWLSDRFGRRQTATITYLSTIIGIACALARHALSLAAAGLRLRPLLRPDAGRARAHHRRHGRPAVSAAASARSTARCRWRRESAPALGSWVSGLLYELTGSYIASFMLAMCGAVIGMASFWLVRSLREERVASGIAPAPAR